MKKPLILVYFILTSPKRGYLVLLICFQTGYVLHMVVHAYHSNIIQDFVCVFEVDDSIWPMVKKNQLSCSRTHILPKIFIIHGLQKIGEVQGTFSNVQIRGNNTGYVLHMVVHAYHSNIIQDFVCVFEVDDSIWPMVKKNQLSCSRTHILPKIFIIHGLQKIGEVQGTF
uniref:Uncharacterized protein n=1 Tax=Brassica oleracea var. oleracea TaxID=109376 RepID=A0A0D3DC70_BRAOL